MTDPSFKSLEEKVDELIQLCTEMKKENQVLREKQHQWQVERSSLISKNELARAKLEKVLQRLKSLQQE